MIAAGVSSLLMTGMRHNKTFFSHDAKADPSHGPVQQLD